MYPTMYTIPFNKKYKYNKSYVSFHNLSRFEYHSILQTISDNKYIDDVQQGVECL